MEFECVVVLMRNVIILLTLHHVYPVFPLSGTSLVYPPVMIIANHPSSFDGMVSTSNAVVSSEVRIVTTKPIWWCIELASGFL